MDFHIDKKMGLLLLGTFILGGLIGGLAGISAGHEGRGWGEGRGRGNFGMMNGSRFGGDSGQEEGALVQQIRMRRNAQQNNVGFDARTENVQAPAVTTPTSPAPVAAPVQ
jgi:hypothetical protein